MSIAIIEKGEQHKEISQRQKELWNADWYYYPEEMKNWEFYKEVRDLENFYDFVYIQDDSPQVCRNSVQQQVPSWVIKEFEPELKYWKVQVLGSARYADEYLRCLFGKCKMLVWSENPCVDADLIICSTGIEKKLNCYPIHGIIIDTSIEGNECYNIECRRVYNRKWLDEQIILKNI